MKPQHDRTADVDVVLDLRGAHDFAAAIARPPVLTHDQIRKPARRGKSPAMTRRFVRS